MTTHLTKATVFWFLSKAIKNIDGTAIRIYAQEYYTIVMEDYKSTSLNIRPLI